MVFTDFVMCIDDMETAILVRSPAGETQTYRGRTIGFYGHSYYNEFDDYIRTHLYNLLLIGGILVISYDPIEKTI